MKTVTFCGQRTMRYDDVRRTKEELYIILEKLVKVGVDQFLIDDNGNFDILCAEIVLELKRKYSRIELQIFSRPSVDTLKKTDILITYTKASRGLILEKTKYAKENNISIIDLPEILRKKYVFHKL